MAILSTVTTRGIVPSQGKKVIYFETAATADSGDTVDVTDSAVTGGETLTTIDLIYAWDQTTGDQVTATESSGTITIDAAGSTTDHVYTLFVIGEA